MRCHPTNSFSTKSHTYVHVCMAQAGVIGGGVCADGSGSLSAMPQVEIGKGGLAEWRRR